MEHPFRSGGPFRTVIVGIDEHQGGRDAMALAQNLVASDGSLVPTRVYIRDALTGRDSSAGAVFGETAPAVGSHGAAGYGDGNGVPGRIDSSSVGRGLHDVADTERADLLVVGSCQRALLGRVMLGDDTSDALNGAPCAIAIAPLGYAERPSEMREIGVAYNETPESERALAVARTLAEAHHSRLSAFQAVSVPYYLTVPGAGAVIESLPALVDQARARIAALGEIEPHAAYGVPAEELAIYSASLDLLVVGSRGYGPFGRLVHGSTSRKLARTARCPLLVLPRNVRALAPVGVDEPGRVSATATVA